jgi:hypothetical protein
MVKDPSLGNNPLELIPWLFLLLFNNSVIRVVTQEQEANYRDSTG